MTCQLPKLPQTSHSYQMSNDSEYGSNWDALYTEDQMRAYAELSIASVKREPPWLPIESAPEDEEFLAFKPGLCSFPARILHADQPDCQYDGGVHEAWSHRFIEGVTYWMPLPAPPVTATTASREKK